MLGKPEHSLHHGFSPAAATQNTVQPLKHAEGVRAGKVRHDQSTAVGGRGPGV